MSKPFTLTLNPNVTEAPRKPGWHKRSLAADRAAFSRGAGVAPQYGRGTAAAESKAIEYARWIAARDGIELPSGGARVEWDTCRAGMRPRWVAFGKGKGLAIELPHWSYEAPEAVALELLPWAPPVVTERCAAPGAPLDEDETAAALALPYCEAPEAEIAGTVEAEPIRDRAEPALCAAPPPVEAIAEPAADEWRPSVATHPIVALCLSDKAREALEARVMDGTWPAAGRSAAGGAWRLTLADARDCADIPSLRLVGMPRKPRTPRVAPPVEAIATRPPVVGIQDAPPAFMVPGAGRPHGAVTFHSAPVA